MEIIEEAKKGRREEGDKQGSAPLGLITSPTHTHTHLLWRRWIPRTPPGCLEHVGPAGGVFPSSFINKLAVEVAGGVTRDHGIKKQRGGANNISQGIKKKIHTLNTKTSTLSISSRWTMDKLRRDRRQNLRAYKSVRT